MAADKYNNFASLKASEPTGQWRVQAMHRGRDIAVIAPHGGAIEPGTSEIARAIAADEIDLYLFEGLKAAGNRDLHITSTRFDEPSALKLLSEVSRVVAIHGEASEGIAVAFLGGLDAELGAAIERELRSAGFEVRRHENPALQGRAAENICNRAQSGRGVQLELSRGLREQLFKSLTAAGRLHPTARLEEFAAAVRCALLA
jgi:phage replication-related protein YjqB (UPF0714/DUF867 family)